MSMKLVTLLMLLSAATLLLGGCSLAGSALQGTGRAFNKAGSTVRGL